MLDLKHCLESLKDQMLKNSLTNTVTLGNTTLKVKYNTLKFVIHLLAQLSHHKL